MDYYSAVKLFHTTFHHAAPDYTTFSPYGDPEKDATLRALRVELIREELEELGEGIANNDVVEIADAVADIVYVGLGALICFGMPDDVSYRPSPNIRGSVGLGAGLGDSFLELHHYLDEFREALAILDKTKTKSALVEIIRAALDAGQHCGIDMDPVFAEVQRANMSKLDENGKPIFREDGKVMKGANYIPPDIKSIIEEQIGAHR